MDTTIGLDDTAHFSDLQGEGSVFEWLLHLLGAKDTEVPAFAGGATVRKLFCELGEFLAGSVDLGLVSLEDFNGFGLRTGYFFFSPTRGVPAPGVFHQEVASPNLCGPGEVFSSGKLTDIFAGEAIGSFPD